MGIPLDEMPVWDPHEDTLGGNTPETLAASRVLLWKGHCSVHQMFRPDHVDMFRAKMPGVKILVHPECPMEVVDKADIQGSTGKIIREVEAAPPGTRWAIGTELHLVNRLKQEHPEQEIHFLSPVVCMCATMYRIDLAHLCWSLENLAAGTPVNIIRVERRNRPLVAHRARTDAGREIARPAAAACDIEPASLGYALVLRLRFPRLSGDSP